MTARISRAAWLRATGQRPETCPEAAEFHSGLVAYHAGEQLNEDQSLSWKAGWRAGEGGRRLPKMRVDTGPPPRGMARKHWEEVA